MGPVLTNRPHFGGLQTRLSQLRRARSHYKCAARTPPLPLWFAVAICGIVSRTNSSQILKWGGYPKQSGRFKVGPIFHESLEGVLAGARGKVEIAKKNRILE